MNNIHPGENELQQYALNKSEVELEVIAHIESCPACQAEISIYNILFSEIKEQPVDTFDFDVRELVLSKLPATKAGLTTDDIIAGFLLLFTCSCIGIPVYVFRKIILNSIIDIPPFFIYSIIVGTSAILIIKILTLYRMFLKKMHLLNTH
ncbi:MAG TPA: hypothetical protein VHT72_11115 [Puia sp.]|nr:hypothetical protein [Puia sp.]